jgi:hypothetical protein
MKQDVLQRELQKIFSVIQGTFSGRIHELWDMKGDSFDEVSNSSNECIRAEPRPDLATPLSISTRQQSYIPNNLTKRDVSVVTWLHEVVSQVT